MDIPTSETVPARPTHEFDPDFWSKLRVGTVLMTDRCHVFVINEITADGVISREWDDPRRLWTWNDLRDCMFSNESVAGIGTYVRERAGLLEPDSPPPMEDWEKLIDKADSDAGRLLDQTLAGELARVLRGKRQPITLRVIAVTMKGTLLRLALRLDRGWWWVPFTDRRLRHAVWCQYQCAAARQPRAWSGMTCNLWRGADGWRYNAAFSYA